MRKVELEKGNFVDVPTTSVEGEKLRQDAARAFLVSEAYLSGLYEQINREKGPLTEELWEEYKAVWTEVVIFRAREMQYAILAQSFRESESRSDPIQHPPKQRAPRKGPDLRGGIGG